jgi:hypothetical protein
VLESLDLIDRMRDELARLVSNFVQECGSIPVVRCGVHAVKSLSLKLASAQAVQLAPQSKHSSAYGRSVPRKSLPGRGCSSTISRKVISPERAGELAIRGIGGVQKGPLPFPLPVWEAGLRAGVGGGADGAR